MVNDSIETYGSIISNGLIEGYEGQILHIIRNDEAEIGNRIIFVGENGFIAYPSPELAYYLNLQTIRKQAFRIEIIDKKKENTYSVLLTRIL